MLAFTFLDVALATPRKVQSALSSN